MEGLRHIIELSPWLLVALARTNRAVAAVERGAGRRDEPLPRGGAILRAPLCSSVYVSNKLTDWLFAIGRCRRCGHPVQDVEKRRG